MDLGLFRERFVFASDAYGIEKPSGPDAIRSPLTDELLQDHLAGRRRIGAYIIDADGYADQIIIDLDIPKEKVNDPAEWERVRADAKRVLSICDDLGVEAFITSSKSRGYHVRSLWERAPAGDLRRAGEFVTRRAGIRVEVFPKQNQRKEGGLGSFVWLPLHGESLKNGKTALVDQANGLAPLPDQWAALRDVRRNSLETLGSVLAVVEEWEQENGPAVRETALPTGAKIPEGLRRPTLFSIAGGLRARGATAREILPTLQEMNTNRCDPPLPDAEVVKLAAGAERYEARTLTKTFHLTDAGNAKRLVEQLNGLGRYCYPFKSWYLFDGKRWVQDQTGGIVAASKAAVRGIYAEAAALEDADRRKTVSGHAMKSETERSLKAMIYLAQSEPGIPVDTSDFDRQPDLLNCLNGTVHLRTGRIKAHDPDDLISQLIPISYDEDAPRDRWLQFMDEVFKGRKDLIDYIQRLIGYGLTGFTTEQIFAIFYGSGSNGKSTLLDTLLEILADYMTTTPFRTFVVQHNEGIRNDLACLHNVRLVATSESSQGQRLNEELVKRTTGDATIKARHLFKEYFTYKRKFKIVMSVNHLPKIRGTDSAIWRRVRLIPFDAVFVDGGNQDKKLGEKLLAESPGVLAWAVFGAMMWHDRGLDCPDDVKKATDTYREEEDTLQGFLDDTCNLGEDLEQPAHALYLAFRDYSGGKVYSEKEFAKHMKSKGFESQKKSKGRVWLQIALLEDHDGTKRRGA